MSVFSLLGQGIAGNWGIFDSGGASAVPFDTFFALNRKDESKVTTHPTEPNGFFAYNRVESPQVVGVILGISGSPATLGAALDALKKLKTGTDLVSVVTPEATLVDYALESYDYQRDAASGVDRLLVSLTFIEIRQVSPEYSNETIPAPKQAADGKTASSGKQVAEKSDSATEERTKSKSRLASIFN